MHLGSKQPHLAMVKDFFLHTAWFGLLHFVKDVCICVHVGHCVLFFCNSFIWFWYQGKSGLVGKYSIFLYFLEDNEKNWH